MDLELKDRVILITGVTDGLGRALAEHLVAEGARVVGCGRDADRVRATALRLGEAAAIVSADVTVSADLERLVSVAEDRWGRIDGLVNNAGDAKTFRIDAVTDDVLEADLTLKVMGAIRLVRLCLPLLRAAPDASIVNVLATAGKAPLAGSLPTTASRAAGLAITKVLSKELAPDGIRVNAVMVGIIESGQWRRRAEATGRPVEEIYAEYAKFVPLGRVGRASEFADLATYLLSPRASYVTGTAINIDGGACPVT
jgi:NAD(P)-dependent dehydrogenase (short-subunit alcohol dehydrogenase family)